MAIHWSHEMLILFLFTLAVSGRWKQKKNIYFLKLSSLKEHRKFGCQIALSEQIESNKA